MDFFLVTAFRRERLTSVVKIPGLTARIQMTVFFVHGIVKNLNIIDVGKIENNYVEFV